MDNVINGRVSNLNHRVTHIVFQFIRNSVTKHISIEEEEDSILHFTSTASPRDYSSNPIHTLTVGAIGTLNALRLVRSKNACFCLASTSEVYGSPLESPRNEAYWGNVNPVGPRNVYDEAERFAESIAMAYMREHEVNTRIIRIFNTYGLRMRPSDGTVLPNFIIQALTGKPLTIYRDRSQTRSFCYVDDLLGGCYRMLTTSAASLDLCSARTINLGGNEEISIYHSHIE